MLLCAATVCSFSSLRIISSEYNILFMLSVSVDECLLFLRSLLLRIILS